MSDENRPDDEISWDDAFEEMAQAGSAPDSEVGNPTRAGASGSAPEAASVQFQPLQGEDVKPGQIDLEFLLDIPLEVRVEVGRTRMVIRDLLQLGQSSVIELSKSNVETSFDVLVNDKIVARGEIVVVNDRFGIRLTDIVSPMERVQHIV